MSTFKLNPRSYTATAIEFDGNNGKEVREFLKSKGYKVRGTNKWVRFWNLSGSYETPLERGSVVVVFPNDGGFAIYDSVAEVLKYFRIKK